MTPLLEIRNICKDFPGVRALDDVSFELRAGEVHCLVGENGAGKSTLMNILSGALRMDAGTVLFDGKVVDIDSPATAQSLGIGIIHQDFKLVPHLSAGENILLGNEPTRGRSPFIDFKQLHNSAANTLHLLGETIDSRTPVSELSIAHRQIVEIAKALSRKSRILAMDEPSAPLSEKELQNLFAVIRRLTSEGVGIVYISHRLEEIFEIGDRLTVLRDGKTIKTCPVKEADRRSLVGWMVGRELETEYPARQHRPSQELLRLEGVSGGIVRDVSFSLRKGEVFGLAGLVGAGRSDLAHVVFGALPMESGRILLDGKEVAPSTPRQAIDLGIGLLTEDRNRYGLIMQMEVRKNISLANLAALMKGPFIQKGTESRVASEYVSRLRIKTPTVDQQVENLSGGNRQKVVLARWLYTRSKILIFDEPTAGIDVGVKYDIYNLINELAGEGVGLIVISSDLPELVGMCDRVGVMEGGRLVAILSGKELTQERIMTFATGSHALEQAQNLHQSTEHMKNISNRGN